MSRAQAEQLKLLNGEYDELTAEELDLVKRLAAQGVQAEYLAAQVTRLNGVLVSTQHEVAEAQAAVDRADAAVRDIDRRLATAQRQLEREQRRLRDQAIEAYIGGGLGTDSAFAGAVLRSSSLNEVGSSIEYADAVLVDQRRAIKRVTDLRNEVNALQVDARDARDIATKARGEIETRRQVVVGQRDEQAGLRQQIEASTLVEQQLLVEVSAKRVDYQQRILLLTQTSDGISGTLEKRQRGQKLPLITAGIFLPAFVNPTISSPYGYRSDPLLGTPRLHAGVDFVAPSGTPIRAAADGVVVIASEQGGYGNCTVIDHGSGLGTLYGHQTAFNVLVGDTVKRGQIIGFVGSTGHSTGPHLHWEVRQFGQPVDPLPFMGIG